MSVQAITCALALRGVSTSEKLVLLALSNYADEHMQCWPSQKRLADDCAMTDRGVRKVLKALEDRHMLSRENRRRADGSRHSDMITLHFAGEVRQAEPRSAPPERRSGAPGTRVHEQAEPRSGLTTFEPSVEEPSIEPILSDSEFEACWKAYPHVKGRSSKRKARLEWPKIGVAIRRVLPAAIRRYAVEGREPNAECGAPAFERWLRDDRYLDWLPVAAVQTTPPTPQEQAEQDAKWQAYLNRLAETQEAANG